MPAWLRYLPHALSLVRIPLAGLIWLRPSAPVFVIAVLAAAAISDGLDGLAARAVRRREAQQGASPERLRSEAHTGGWLDPLCDKLFVLSAVAALAWTVQLSLAALVLIATREILQAPLLVAYRLHSRQWRLRHDLTARWPGKLTTVLQFLALGLGVLGHPALMPAACLSSIAGALSVAYYVVRLVQPQAR